MQLNTCYLTNRKHFTDIHRVKMLQTKNETAFL